MWVFIHVPVCGSIVCLPLSAYLYPCQVYLHKCVYVSTSSFVHDFRVDVSVHEAYVCAPACLFLYVSVYVRDCVCVCVCLQRRL